MTAIEYLISKRSQCELMQKVMPTDELVREIKRLNECIRIMGIE